MQALTLLFQRRKLPRDAISLTVDCSDRSQILNNDKTADDLGDIKQSVLRKLACRVQFGMHGVLLFFGKLCIVGFQLVTLFHQLFELHTAFIQVLDRIGNILRSKVIQGTAIIHRAAVGLMI